MRLISLHIKDPGIKLLCTKYHVLAVNAKSV